MCARTRATKNATKSGRMSESKRNGEKLRARAGARERESESES
jgi:hypothetical protein